jgi:hypothetical protein
MAQDWDPPLLAEEGRNGYQNNHGIDLIWTGWTEPDRLHVPEQPMLIERISHA